VAIKLSNIYKQFYELWYTNLNSVCCIPSYTFAIIIYNNVINNVRSSIYAHHSPRKNEAVIGIDCIGHCVFKLIYLNIDKTTILKRDAMNNIMVITVYYIPRNVIPTCANVFDVAMLYNYTVYTACPYYSIDVNARDYIVRSNHPMLDHAS